MKRCKAPPEETMQLQLTENAVRKVKQLLEAENKAGYGLRIAVQGGGCSGFQYGLTWDKESRPGDIVQEFEGLKVFVDPMSGQYLEAVRVDYLEGLNGSGFKIDNPNAAGTCGCGSSFTV